ncbi:H(+)-transporting V0 sector ATPase subunit a [Perkinsus chesapeaki]|uniref:V-type proton ATPase subunit a n=1 Tax=Perkinsus chesapeaki TaxID=330153 RepID=A0A7J6N1N8_PERCH|nr:H(+)-transporting V0 sector ATPase subunit a [Perkinsus chesapeaki]
MGLLRSETMKHGTLVLPTDRAREFVDVIGYSTRIEFEDMNSASMNRNYRKYVQRIEELERIIRFLEAEIETAAPHTKIRKGHINTFLMETADSYRLDTVEVDLKRIYKRFVKFQENNAELVTSRNAALEEKYVCFAASNSQVYLNSTGGDGLTGTGVMAGSSPQEASLIEEGEALTGGYGRSSRATAGVSCIAGVLLQSDQARFARTLFRATFGNTFTDFVQIPEPLRDAKTGENEYYSVFVVYFQGYSATTGSMAQKIRRICTAFGARMYPWPHSEAEANSRMRVLDELLIDKLQALDAYRRFIGEEVDQLVEPVRLGGNSLIEDWSLFLAKEKGIYTLLNKFEGDVTLRCDCWYPAEEEDDIRHTLFRMSSTNMVGAMLLTDHDRLYSAAAVDEEDASGHSKGPPTYMKTNEVTQVAQDLVDTYGVPRYKEANPALFTIVTFPFLFGVMFGDVGHGAMLFLLGMWAIIQGPQLDRSFPMLRKLRYMVVAMGFFAIYAGLMYNDFFAVGLNLFGSRWDCSGITCRPLYDITNTGNQKGSYPYTGPYPFGLDPVWHGATNELVYVNSMKMKTSVLFGVVQMLLGIFLKFSNAIYERSALDLFCECIPQLVFLLSFFGYMDWMILYKWTHDITFNPAPGLINTLIAMGLGQGVKPGQVLYPNQGWWQSLLILLALVSVPIMLIPKPLILWWRHRETDEQFMERQRAHAVRRRDEAGVGLMDGGDSVEMVEGGSSSSSSSSSTAAWDTTRPHTSSGPSKKKVTEDEEQEFDLGDVVIHQVIETIEFVLGTVSHTASYLRLWALSLAHQQLSLVFLEMTVFNAMSSGPYILNAIGIYISFAIFFGITVAVLMGMDVLECFLHVLRLHWVEFQSKFFLGDGHKFEPYSHESVLEQATQT